MRPYFEDGQSQNKIVFEPVERKFVPGWYVLVRLSSGRQPQFGHFQTEAEALDWIKNKSAAWLKEYDEGPYEAKVYVVQKAVPRPSAMRTGLVGPAMPSLADFDGRAKALAIRIP
jgi:hypothetical protein